MRMAPGSRQVLIKIVNRTVDEKTPSGIIKIANTDLDWVPSRHSDRRGVVVACPRHRLPFAVSADIMPWQTSIEISKGMTVWFDFLASENCVTYIDEFDFHYKLLNYDDLYVATFPRKKTESINGVQKTKDETEYVIPLNGYHIIERVYHESRSKFDLFGPMRVDRRYGIVKYVAKNNQAYENGLEEDHVELKVGDRLRFSTVPEVMLEDEAHCHFDGGTMYRRAQARNVDVVWRDGEMILPNGRILVRQILDEDITPAGIILQKPNVKQHQGTVIVSSIGAIPKGSKIMYIKGAGMIINYKEEECRVLKETEILYIV